MQPPLLINMELNFIIVDFCAACQGAYAEEIRAGSM
jgi:hypothetical protein